MSSKSRCGDPRTLVPFGGHSIVPPDDWYIALFPDVPEDKSPLKFRGIIRDKKLATVRLLPQG